ncbi:YutD family protein [Paenibacillus bovis]|uniref:YutD family protein n=1 Tax=Paenibacillus bovis TaxID=1616788 RepID=UPI0009EA35A3|nr:YutD family protein [Paenibacillus bovis]
MIQIGGKTYELIKEHRDGWNVEVFRDRYSEVLDRYDYILGDWGYNQLRLKGFYRDGHPKAGKDTSLSSLTEYINEYCNFGCAYFVLQKVKDTGNPPKSATEEDKAEKPDRPSRGHGSRKERQDKNNKTDKTASADKGSRSKGNGGSKPAAETKVSSQQPAAEAKPAAQPAGEPKSSPQPAAESRPPVQPVVDNKVSPPQSPAEVKAAAEQPAVEIQNPPQSPAIDKTAPIAPAGETRMASPLPEEPNRTAENPQEASQRSE